jgi:hypothetical protein
MRLKMKYTITIILLTVFFSIQTFTQEKNKRIPSPYTNLIERLKDIHNYQTDDKHDLNKVEFIKDDTRNNKLIKKLEKLENDFYDKVGLNDNNSRTTTIETLLADGFLQVEAITQTWDGTNWVNSSRSTSLYDVRNNKTQRTYQNWNVSAWENSSKYLYTYDANDNQTEQIYQTWSGGIWVNNNRSVITYDSNNNATEYIYQSWSGTAWTNDSRYLYTYDSNNNTTQYIYQTWDGTVWVDNSRNTYTYDSNNNRILQIYETFNGTVWVNVNKYSSTYDVNNNLTQEIYQTWDGTNWVNGNRYTYTYDSNDNMIISLSETWDVNVWKNSSQYLITYDSNDNPIEYLFQSWDVSVWKNSYRYSYIYDANNNVIDGLYQSWDISVWKNEQRFTYTYNANNDPTEYLYQFWDVTVWKNDSKYTFIYDSNNNNTEYTYQSWDGTTWVNQNKYLYTWAVETSIVVTSPNGEENWPVGTSKNITWTSSNVSNVKLQYSTNNGTNWINITNVSASAGSYSWTVPNTISSNCKVLISDVSNALLFDVSDSVFAIVPPASITLNAPNGGESWDVGSSHSITWTSVSIDSVKIDYSTNNGTNWLNIVSSTVGSTGSYNWTVPNTASTNCKVLISDLTNALVNDQSNNVFTIKVPVTPTINVTSPNGGENWDVGSTTHSITWTSNSVTNVKIDYSTNNGSSWINIVPTTPSDGSYSWTIPNTPSANCKVQISDVTNALINDQSNSVFTISVPVTPVVTVTSPNGGENWDAGSVHSITWVSSNITKVKIDYSTNNGTNWTNIISSTTASTGSYSWTVPNTVSTSCKVQISDTSNALINDQSNAVFTIFTYPATITLTKTYSFGDATQTSSYQMIGLPGDNNIPLASIMTGSPGASGDWRAFWDPGAGAFTEYTSSGSTFNFTPGKAFWVVSKNQINVNIPNVNTVTLAPDNTYSIPLHSDWNLISNPFDKSITWSSIQTENGVTQPIHFYQNGSYSNPTNFENYKGYYFFNSGSLTSLKIPYSASTPLPKQNSVSTELEIALKADDVQIELINIGVSEDAKQGVDLLDIFSPPSQFCEISMSLFNNELETNYKYLQKDYRTEIGEGQEFSLNVKNLSNQTLNMIASGMNNFMDYEIYLVDKSFSKLYDLKKKNSFEVRANTTEKQYSLLIGTEEFIIQKKLDLMPTEFALYQNYPNPFNPATKIKFSLPLQSSVSLKIYNILGELAAELINNQSYDAGYYEVNFDGSQLASGIYLYELQTSSSGRQPFIEIKKMMLIK